MVNLVNVFVGVLNREFQVFGSDRIGNLAGFFNGTRHDDGTAVIERSGNDVFAGHAFDLTINGFGHFVGKFGVIGQQNCLSQFVMFCLAEKIHRDRKSTRLNSSH